MQYKVSHTQSGDSSVTRTVRLLEGAMIGPCWRCNGTGQRASDETFGAYSECPACYGSRTCKPFIPHDDESERITMPSKRFVSFVDYRDELLGIDSDGDIYVITLDHGNVIVQLLTRNPLEQA